MKIKKILLTLLVSLCCHAVYADSIPCRVENNVVLCPANFKNAGNNNALLRNKFGTLTPFPANTTKDFDIEFDPISGSVTTLDVVDESSQKHGCRYSFILEKIDENFYADYKGMETLGSPKMCELGAEGEPKLIAEADVGPALASGSLFSH